MSTTPPSRDEGRVRVKDINLALSGLPTSGPPTSSMMRVGVRVKSFRDYKSHHHLADVLTASRQTRALLCNLKAG
jgi:hypothetical protein